MEYNKIIQTVTSNYLKKQLKSEILFHYPSLIVHCGACCTEPSRILVRSPKDYQQHLLGRNIGRLHGVTCETVGNKSITPRFKSRLDYAIMIFHLSLRLNDFGSRSDHLAYRAHRSDVQRSYCEIQSSRNCFGQYEISI